MEKSENFSVKGIAVRIGFAEVRDPEIRQKAMVFGNKFLESFKIHEAYCLRFNF